MGSSEGEAIAPDVEGAGGSRAYQGGDAGCAMPPRPRCRSRSSRRRERQLETVRLIGQGSDALVYLVRCKVTGRRSALKVQRKADHERSAERVHMEREVMVDARHPLVAPLYAAFQDRLYLYLDMEYCPGGSLDNFVRYCLRRNLTEDEARFFAAEITLGLEFLHSKGYVYRDLKAANVLVAGSGHIKLTDFGIAERGKVKIETDDRMWHEPSPSDPLPRTKSSPGLTEVVAAAAAKPAISPTLSGACCSRPTHLNQNASCAAAAAAGGIASSGHPGPSGAFSSRTKVSNRRASHPGFASTTADGGSRAPKLYEDFEDTSATPTACDSELLMATAAAGPTPPRPPTLGRRIRSKFRRGSRGSLSAGSIPPSALSVDLGAAEVVAGGTLPSSAGQGGLTGGAQQHHHHQKNHHHQSSDGLGMPPPSPARVAGPVPARDCAQKLDASGRGFPWPDGAEEAVPQDRSLSPTVNRPRRTATRQTTVTLAESSWGLLSGSPEYMAPEVLLHDPQGSAVDWWGLGILTYELLLGQTPFAGENGKTRFTFLNIMHKDARFPGPGEREEGDVSTVCQRFIRALLSKDPRGRVGSRGAHAVKAHPFFSSVSWDRLLEQEPPLVPRRFGNECGVPPVHNTSGWWWDAEDAADLEADEAAAAAAAHGRGGGRKAGGRGGVVDQGRGGEGWWPFDRFTWSEGIGGEGVLFPAEFGAAGRACSRGRTVREKCVPMGFLESRERQSNSR